MNYLWPTYIGGGMNGVRLPDVVAEARPAIEYFYDDEKTRTYRRITVRAGHNRIDGYVGDEHDPSDAAALLLDALVVAAIPETQPREDNHARSEEDVAIGDPHRRP
jgi:hypothetical protein